MNKTKIADGKTEIINWINYEFDKFIPSLRACRGDDHLLKIYRDHYKEVAMTVFREISKLYDKPNN